MNDRGIQRWIRRVVESFETFESREMAHFPQGREIALAQFVIRALANPKCEGSEQMIAAISDAFDERMLTNENSCPVDNPASSRSALTTSTPSRLREKTK